MCCSVFSQCQMPGGWDLNKCQIPAYLGLDSCQMPRRCPGGVGTLGFDSYIMLGFFQFIYMYVYVVVNS